MACGRYWVKACLTKSSPTFNSHEFSHINRYVNIASVLTKSCEYGQSSTLPPNLSGTNIKFHALIAALILHKYSLRPPKAIINLAAKLRSGRGAQTIPTFLSGVLCTLHWHSTKPLLRCSLLAKAHIRVIMALRLPGVLVCAEARPPGQLIATSSKWKQL